MSPQERERVDPKLADPRLLEADGDVTHLAQCMADGMGGLAYVPVWLERVLEHGYWRERVRRGTGAVIRFDSFEEFVSMRPYWGLGSTVEQVRNLVRTTAAGEQRARNAKLLDLMDQAMQRTPADNMPLDNVQEQFPSGNSSAAALRRLRKDRPDLHARVLAGELSVNAAAIEAGFRRKTWQAPDDIEQLAAAIERRYPDWQLTPRRKNGNA